MLVDYNTYNQKKKKPNNNNYKKPHESIMMRKSWGTEVKLS